MRTSSGVMGSNNGLLKRTFRYRLYPSKTVERELSRQLELCRWLYNRLLEELNRA